MFYRLSITGTFLMVLLAGCTEDVTVTLGTDQAYSLYGFMNPQADTQWVRVYPIEGELGPVSPEPLDAHFTSLELETGETRVWRDSLLTFPGGGQAHVFWSPFRARYDHTYRLEVERSDGAVTHVEVKTPRPVRARQMPPEIAYVNPDKELASRVVLPVVGEGTMPRVLSVDAEYTLLTDIIPGPTPMSFIKVYNTVRIPYDDRIREGAGTWEVDIDLRRDYMAVRDSLTALREWRPSFGASIALLTLRMDVVDEEWAAFGDEFDPEVLIQPGTFSNVENGFGFVGAGFRQRIPLLVNDEWDPVEQEAEKAAGFKPCPC